MEGGMCEELQWREGCVKRCRMCEGVQGRE